MTGLMDFSQDHFHYDTSTLVNHFLCRIHMKKESSKISRSTSSTCSFSIPGDDTHLVSVTQVFPIKQVSLLCL